MTALLVMQRELARAIVHDQPHAGFEPRLAVHRRHYAHSLSAALAAKYPVAEALVGEGFFRFMAAAFVRVHPPMAPCIAEYGGAFAGFIDRFTAAASVPYLGDVARLEWALNQAAMAAPGTALRPEQLAATPPERLEELRFRFLPGYHLLALEWPADAVVRDHLDDAAEALAVTRGAYWLEVRGGRGAVQVRRLEAGAFVLRRALVARRTLGEAIAEAVEAAPFDLPAALAALFADGLFAAALEPGKS